eukprot:756427-Hanusia_phi.AAC.1
MQEVEREERPGALAVSEKAAVCPNTAAMTVAARNMVACIYGRGRVHLSIHITFGTPYPTPQRPPTVLEFQGFFQVVSDPLPSLWEKICALRGSYTP